MAARRNQALYIGDNVDDALAAQSAEVPFLAILPRTGEERRQRSTRLRELGALDILSDISELEAWLQQPQNSLNFVPVPPSHQLCRIFVSTKHDTGTIVPAADFLPHLYAEAGLSVAPHIRDEPQYPARCGPRLYPQPQHPAQVRAHV